jgi:hypothetical protein
VKIPLRIRRQFDEPMVFTDLVIRAPHVRRPSPTEFLADTGSPWTSIAPRDARRLGIPISALRAPQKFATVSLAGSSFHRYLVEDATAYLRDEGGRMVSVQLPAVSVLWPTKGKPEEFDYIPSVLGCDFLTPGNFQLHVDLNKNVAFLERKIQLLS